jgi:hypothetical protein
MWMTSQAPTLSENKREERGGRKRKPGGGNLGWLRLESDFTHLALAKIVSNPQLYMGSAIYFCSRMGKLCDSFTQCYSVRTCSSVFILCRLGFLFWLNLFSLICLVSHGVCGVHLIWPPTNSPYDEGF